MEYKTSQSAARLHQQQSLSENLKSSILILSTHIHVMWNIFKTVWKVRIRNDWTRMFV